jgi:hypothetical protein
MCEHNGVLKHLGNSYYQCEKCDKIMDKHMIQVNQPSKRWRLITNIRIREKGDEYN